MGMRLRVIDIETTGEAPPAEIIEFEGSQRRGDNSLHETSRLVDWTEIDRILVDVSTAAKEKLS